MNERQTVEATGRLEANFRANGSEKERQPLDRFLRRRAGMLVILIVKVVVGGREKKSCHTALIRSEGNRVHVFESF